MTDLKTAIEKYGERGAEAYTVKEKLVTSYQDCEQDGYEAGFQSALELLWPAILEMQQLGQAMPPNAISMYLQRSLTNLRETVERM